MSTFQECLLTELQELTRRLDRLKGFIVDDAFDELDLQNRDLLKAQCGIMRAYEAVLQNRIGLLTQGQG